jgi:hypothetical protein
MTQTPPASQTPPAPARLDEDAFCPECRYNLRGVESNRCPECGREFDRATLRVSAIPWVHRHEIGRFRAYWRTVWFVTASTRRFADELSRPTPYADAQRFRWTTVLILCLSLPLIGAVLYGADLLPAINDPLTSEVLSMVWPAATVIAAFVLALAAMTGLPGYAFHPPSVPVNVQNRAIALSYYACAPLGLSVVMALLLGGSLVLEVMFSRHNGIPSDPAFLAIVVSVLSGVLGTLGFLLSPVFWWLALWRLGRRLFQHTHRGRLLYIAALPILWPAVAVLIVGGISLVVGYIALFVDSLS